MEAAGRVDVVRPRPLRERRRTVIALILASTISLVVWLLVAVLNVR
jgi:hypothetical protein